MSKEIRVIVIMCGGDIDLRSGVLWRNVFSHLVDRLGKDCKDESDRANALIP